MFTFLVKPSGVSDHPKFKVYVIAYGRWSLVRSESKGAFCLLGLAELKELVFAGVNGKRKSTPHASLPRIGNCFAALSAIFGTRNSSHFASSPHRSVKTDWPYSKDRASSARTSSVSSHN